MIYGYPFGELLGKSISVNRSSVSSLRKESGKLRVVQLAGGLNPGNSGGPVTNIKGEVIGVSVAKLRGAETIGFAIPAEEVDAFVKDQHQARGRFNTGGLVAIGPNPDPPPNRSPIRPPVRPPVKLPEEVPLVLPPVKPIVITPADVAATGTEVKLPDEGTEACVGGGGRFLIVSLPKVKQIAVFDASQAKAVKYLPAPAEAVLAARRMGARRHLDGLLSPAARVPAALPGLPRPSTSSGARKNLRKRGDRRRARRPQSTKMRGATRRSPRPPA